MTSPHFLTAVCAAALLDCGLAQCDRVQNESGRTLGALDERSLLFVYMSVSQ